MKKITIQERDKSTTVRERGDTSMSQWNLIIDVERCENCNNCVLANADEYVGNDFPGYSAPHALHGPGTIRIERRVRGGRAHG